MAARFALRPAASEDRPALSTFVPDAERATLDRMIDDGRCFVALDHGRPVVALVWPPDDEAPVILGDPGAASEVVDGAGAWLAWYARTAQAVGALRLHQEGRAASPAAA